MSMAGTRRMHDIGTAFGADTDAAPGTFTPTFKNPTGAVTGTCLL